MSNDNFVTAKLDALASASKGTIGEAIVGVRSEATLAGAHGGSRMYIYTKKALREGFGEALNQMSRLLIDLRINADTTSQDQFRQAAQRMTDELIAAHATSLFPTASFVRDADTIRQQAEAAIRSELAGDTELAIQSAQRQIVGHARYEPNQTERATMNVNVNNSPGANVQQGRDHLTQNVQQTWDGTKLLEVLVRLQADMASGAIGGEDVEALRAQVGALEAQVKAKTVRLPFIKAAGELVKNMLNAAGTTAASEYARELIKQLPS